ncbi:MAG TPA: hypothetical protein VE269_01125 [Gaiellaceae bacterium]|nr:hypothetical protein [Gaiellaceae bacterium]
MTQDPFLAALLDGYATTLDRLRRSFVGPDPIDVPEPLSAVAFADAYRSDGAEGHESVRAFRRLERRALGAAGIDDHDLGAADAYERYEEWFPFAYAQRVVLARVARALGYETPIGGAPLDSPA